MNSLFDILAITPEDKIHVLDCGAAFNHDSRYRALVAGGRARVTAIDANPDTLDKIDPQFRENYTLVPAIIGDGRDVSFYETGHPVTCSVFEPNSEFLQRFATFGVRDATNKVSLNVNWQVMNVSQLQTKQLDALDIHDVDYIKLDIQGAELDALKGGENLLRDVLVIESEIEFAPLYKNQPLFHDIAGYLWSQGFMVHKLVDIQGRPLLPIVFDKSGMVSLGQALWADGVFIRYDLVAEPEKFPAARLFKAAVLMHDLYHSYDVAHFFLAAADKKSGQNLADRYRTYLGQNRIHRYYFNLVDQSPSAATAKQKVSPGTQ